MVGVPVSQMDDALWQQHQHAQFPQQSQMLQLRHHQRQQQEPKPKQVVRFSYVTIRNYDITLGDNPAVYCGPPIQLDWNYEEIAPLSVRDFELFKVQRRQSTTHNFMFHNADNGVMPIYPDFRRGILKRAGFTDKEIGLTEREVKKIQAQRHRTKLTFPFYHMEYAVRSAGRKIQRTMGSGTSSSSGGGGSGASPKHSSSSQSSLQQGKQGDDDSHKNYYQGQHPGDASTAQLDDDDDHHSLASSAGAFCTGGARSVQYCPSY
ncbi:MAG: hypothetical protein SGILL_008150 [Bacillariaceae sp.]